MEYTLLPSPVQTHALNYKTFGTVQLEGSAHGQKARAIEFTLAGVDHVTCEAIMQNKVDNKKAKEASAH